MTSKADTLAIKAILSLLAFIAILYLSRSFILEHAQWSAVLWKTPSIPSSMPVPVALATPNPPPQIKIATPDPEPEVRKATAVRRSTPLAATPVPPTPVQQYRQVRVAPKRWSELVVVPEGRSAHVTFQLGKIRVERNGMDIGTFYRNPTLQRTDLDPYQYNVRIRPWASVDKTPRTIIFDSHTRTLRFASLETDSENVFVDFRK